MLPAETSAKPLQIVFIDNENLDSALQQPDNNRNPADSGTDNHHIMCSHISRLKYVLVF